MTVSERSAVESVSAFEARRAVERIRSGLFDPMSIRLLTAGGDRLEAAAARGLEGRSTAPHLCLVGAYGLGKSHGLRYLGARALEQNFAVSLVSLDPREVPFHRPRDVYRAMMEGLRLPGEGGALWPRWRAFVRASGEAPEALLSEGMPHLFRCSLSGGARQTLPLSARQRAQRQHRNFRPRAFPHHLKRAAFGAPVPLNRVRHALRYRQVPGYTAQRLSWRGPEPVIQMTRSLAALFQRMGMAGWVVLFDEVEAIAQSRAPSRRKAYDFLSRWLAPDAPAPGLFPVFAFTEDLLWKMEADDAPLRREQLTLHTLGDLTASEWAGLADRLVPLHARAFGWRPDPTAVGRALRTRLGHTGGAETRLKLKALVDELDLQEQALDAPGG